MSRTTPDPITELRPPAEYERMTRHWIRVPLGRTGNHGGSEAISNWDQCGVWTIPGWRTMTSQETYAEGYRYVGPARDSASAARRIAALEAELARHQPPRVSITAAELCRRASVDLAARLQRLDTDLQQQAGCRMGTLRLHDHRPFEELGVVVTAVPVDPNAGKHAPQPIVGRVTGKPYEGDQCRGMPRAICHACGLGYRCWNPDCEQTGEAPSLANGPPTPTGATR